MNEDIRSLLLSVLIVLAILCATKYLWGWPS